MSRDSYVVHRKSGYCRISSCMHHISSARNLDKIKDYFNETHYLVKQACNIHWSHKAAITFHILRADSPIISCEGWGAEVCSILF